MDEQQTPDARPEPPATAQLAANAPANPDAKGQVVVGGLLAGLGLSLAAAFVMHVVQEASPIGYGISINGSVLAVVLLAGPVFGLGLAMALIGLMPISQARATPPKIAPAQHENPSAGG
jgi:hypothetical protein